jgi:hypothetical protein
MPKFLKPPLVNYFHFLKLSSKVDSIFQLKEFSPSKKALFQEIFQAWFNESPLAVREAMALSHLGSPATLHKRIARLRELKLVEAVYQIGDKRTKYLHPSDTGLKYIEMLAHCLAQTTSS